MRQNKDIRKRIFQVLMVAWAILIFMFSARDGVQSEGDSYTVGMKVGAIIFSDFDTWTEEEQLDFAKKVDHPIRKTAHATEYAVFAMLIFGAFYDGEKAGRRNYGLPWLIATLYAASDETHQLFVPGRSGQVSDVCLDSVGAMAGLLLLWMMIAIVVSIKKTKNRNKT